MPFLLGQMATFVFLEPVETSCCIFSTASLPFLLLGGCRTGPHFKGRKIEVVNLTFFNIPTYHLKSP